MDFSDPYGYPLRIKHLQISRVWPTRMEKTKTPEFVAMSWPEVPETRVMVPETSIFQVSMVVSIVKS